MAESYVCMGLYEDLATAKRMYENLVAMGRNNLISLHDAAVVQRREDGSVTLVEFGGATGGLVHLVTRRLSRSDAKELGELLDRGDICLIAVTEDASAETVMDVLGEAKERVGRHMKTDAKDLAEALRSAG